MADYPLQGDFLAKAKNHRQPIPGVPFYWALGCHAAIQAGAVWLITGDPLLGLAEFIAHTTIDYLKSEGMIDFDVDQSLHVACKVLMALSVVFA